ncbi:MAG: hypothetical protein RLZZ223_507 [Candidatus Parcubacteria bacterium]|jgi:prepilin-type N-terminal cleavage/methylation domain-containing protein
MNKKGFTLIELTIVVSILSILMLVISQPLVSIIKYQREAQKSDNMRDNLQFTLNKMEKELKTSSASSFIVIEDASTKKLSFKNQFGGNVTYFFDSSKNLITKNDENLTESDVFKVDDAYFTINKDERGQNKLITVVVKASAINNVEDEVKMQISVAPLNK